MTLEIVRSALAWCAVINIVVLISWFLFFTLARDWIYRYHSKWFNLSDEKFDSINYAGMGLFNCCDPVSDVQYYSKLRFLCGPLPFPGYIRHRSGIVPFVFLEPRPGLAPGSIFGFAVSRR